MSIVTIASVALLFINRRYLGFHIPVVAVLATGLLIAFVAACYSGLILKGFDWTFTGRSVIWREYWKLSLQRPWFGYGFGGTWQEDEIFGELRQNAKGMTSAHNAFLAVLFNGGIALMGVFALWLFAIIREIVSCSSDWYSKVAAFFAVIAGLLLAMFEAMFSPNIAVSFAAFILFFGLIYMREVSRTAPPLAAPSPAGSRGRLRPAPIPGRTTPAATTGQR